MVFNLKQNTMPEPLQRKVLELRDKGLMYHEIHAKTGVAEVYINYILQGREISTENPLKAYIEWKDREKARKLAAQVLETLGLTFKRRQMNEYLRLITRLRSKVGPKTKFRSIKRLTRSAVFMFLRLERHGIPFGQYIDKLGLNRKTIARDIRLLTPMIPAYANRDKKQVILALIERYLESQGHSELMRISVKVMFCLFYNHLKNTIEELTSASLVALTIIFLKSKRPYILKMSGFFGVRASSVNYQLSNKLPRMRLEGGVINNKDILQPYLEDSVKKHLKLLKDHSTLSNYEYLTMLTALASNSDEFKTICDNLEHALKTPS